MCEFTALNIALFFFRVSNLFWPSRKEMRLFIRPLILPGFALSCEDTETVGDVQRKIAERTGVPAELCLLSFGSKRLRSKATLVALGVAEDTTFALVFGCSPCGKRRAACVAWEESRAKEKKFKSEEAQALQVPQGEEKRDALQAAKEAESRYLEARGRVYDSTGKVNAPGNQLYGVRLQSFEADTAIIRVDVEKIPECWMEIFLKVPQLECFIAREQDSEQSGEDSED